MLVSNGFAIPRLVWHHNHVVLGAQVKKKARTTKLRDLKAEKDPKGGRNAGKDQQDF